MGHFGIGVNILVGGEGWFAFCANWWFGERVGYIREGELGWFALGANWWLGCAPQRVLVWSKLLYRIVAGIRPDFYYDSHISQSERV